MSIHVCTSRVAAVTLFTFKRILFLPTDLSENQQSLTTALRRDTLKITAAVAVETFEGKWQNTGKRHYSSDSFNNVHKVHSHKTMKHLSSCIVK